MILSLLNLDRKAISEYKIHDEYSLHRVVYSLFEDVRKDKQESSGILYVDKGGNSLKRQILILSNRPAHIPQFGSIESKEVPEKLFEYSHYRFELILNPTKRDNISSKRLPLKEKEEVTQWVIKKAQEQWGFEAIDKHLDVRMLSVLTYTAKNMTHTHNRAKLLGILKVLDKEQFKHSFTHGIGKAKAFGCGLLQIQPIEYNKE